jgi:hypothetical protein
VAAVIVGSQRQGCTRLIVISGGLVLVAAVLLVLGIATPHISFVYAAIGLAIVSAVFLLVGVFQRPVPASEPHESESDGTRRQASRRDDDSSDRPARQRVKVPAAAETEYDDEVFEPDERVDHIDLVDVVDPDEVAADFPLEKANADFEVRSGATNADVLVISGRPRYHVGGCEYVEGNDDSEPLEINEARELGFTPCGACRPNETLARSASGKEHASHPKPSPTNVSEPVTASYEPAPVAVAAAAPVADPQQNHQSHQLHQTHAAPPQQAAPAPPPVSEPVAYSAPPAPPAPPPVAAPPQAMTPPPEMTPPPVAAPPPAAEPPATARAGRVARTVLAVASTKEYHRPDCEMLAGAEAEEITKVAAIRQGYLACGICKP